MSSTSEDQSSAPRHRSSEPSKKAHSGQNQPDVLASDVPSQYTEGMETFRTILKPPNPRESMPRSATAVMGLDDEKGR